MRIYNFLFAPCSLRLPLRSPSPPTAVARPSSGGPGTPRNGGGATTMSWTLREVLLFPRPDRGPSQRGCEQAGWWDVAR